MLNISTAARGENMDLRQLRYFVAVAEELHFGRAAAKLHIAQPPLSMQIKRMERQLGVPLFRRTKRHVELTSAGNALLNKARAVLILAQQAVDDAQMAGRGELGRLSIGFASSLLYSILPDIIQDFRAKYPGVAMEFHELMADDQVAMLMNGQIDVALVRPPIGDHTFESMIILEEPIILALPQHHPAASRKAVRLRDFADEPFVMFRRHMGAHFYDHVIVLCKTAGFSPRVAMDADRTQTVLGLVAAGMGIAIVPGSIRNLVRPGVVYRTLLDSSAVLAVLAVWRAGDQLTCLHTFLQCVRDRCDKDLLARSTPQGARVRRPRTRDVDPEAVQ